LCDNLDAIINSSYDGIAVLDKDGKLVKQNDSYKRLFDSLTTTELSDAAEVIASVGKKAIADKAPSSLMYKLPEGKELFITGNPVYNKKSAPARVVINLRDMSEVNDLRRQLEASKELTLRYYSELKTLRARQLDSNIVIGHSPAIKNIFDQVARIAKVDSTVLVLGESGVGKEVVAKLIHKESNRTSGPFIHINCGAIPENLLESELFGYESGAFTGAKREGKPGMFELAHTGTLLLDEIADLPLAMQVKLLSVIQNREVTRIGGTKPIRVDIRLLAATNQRLPSLVDQGKFRADLYYRLNVIPLNIPALRERKEDIPSFISHFLKKYNKKYKMHKVLDPKVVDYMIDYSWPGNVRELENLIERLVVVNKGDYVTISGLSSILPVDSSQINYDVRCNDEQDEKKLIARLYKQYQSTRKVGALLGIHQSTVVRKMKKYGIKARRYASKK
ncbi:MAG TPA: sigma 54-interacting transcriptional regulator, partial [Clostridia bacterium]|nr:sigma 54-interacting transcriptional regulator [Clostridia bacterium]